MFWLAAGSVKIFSAPMVSPFLRSLEMVSVAGSKASAVPVSITKKCSADFCVSSTFPRARDIFLVFCSICFFVLVVKESKLYTFLTVSDNTVLNHSVLVD